MVPPNLPRDKVHSQKETLWLFFNAGGRGEPGRKKGYPRKKQGGTRKGGF